MAGWDLLPLFSHLAFNSQASWPARQCQPLWKLQQLQEKKIPDNIFMIQTTILSPNNTLVSDISEVCGLGGIGMVSHQKSQAVPTAAGAVCFHVLHAPQNMHQHVLWAAHSVGPKVTCTCISGPVCQSGRGGEGYKFSSTRDVGQKPC